MASSNGARLLFGCMALFVTFGAHAEIFSACAVKPTKDGFVALRVAPTRAASVLARMHPGHVVVLDVRNGAFVRARGWVRLSWFPGEAMPNPGNPGYDKVKRGWASWELIDDCG